MVVLFPHRESKNETEMVRREVDCTHSTLILKDCQHARKVFSTVIFRIITRETSELELSHACLLWRELLLTMGTKPRQMRQKMGAFLTLMDNIAHNLYALNGCNRAFVFLQSPLI